MVNKKAKKLSKWIEGYKSKVTRWHISCTEWTLLQLPLVRAAQLKSFLLCMVRMQSSSWVGSSNYTDSKSGCSSSLPLQPETYGDNFSLRMQLIFQCCPVVLDYDLFTSIVFREVTWSIHEGHM